MNDHFQKQSTTHAVQQDSHIKTLEYNNNEGVSDGIFLIELCLYFLIFHVERVTNGLGV